MRKVAMSIKSLTSKQVQSLLLTNLQIRYRSIVFTTRERLVDILPDASLLRDSYTDALMREKEDSGKVVRSTGWFKPLRQPFGDIPPLTQEQFELAEKVAREKSELNSVETTEKMYWRLLDQYHSKFFGVEEEFDDLDKSGKQLVNQLQPVAINSLNFLPTDEARGILNNMLRNKDIYCVLNYLEKELNFIKKESSNAIIKAMAKGEFFDDSDDEDPFRKPEDSDAADGGRSQLDQWQSEAPIGFVKSVYYTRRGVQIEATTAMNDDVSSIAATVSSEIFPGTPMEVGESLHLTIQRQDCPEGKRDTASGALLIGQYRPFVFPNPKGRRANYNGENNDGCAEAHPRGWGTGTKLHLRINAMRKVCSGGAASKTVLDTSKRIAIDPPAVVFGEDGQSETITITMLEPAVGGRTGATEEQYEIEFNLMVDDPSLFASDSSRNLSVYPYSVPSQADMLEESQSRANISICVRDSGFFDFKKFTKRENPKRQREGTLDATDVSESLIGEDEDGSYVVPHGGAVFFKKLLPFPYILPASEQLSIFQPDGKQSNVSWWTSPSPQLLRLKELSRPTRIDFDIEETNRHAFRNIGTSAHSNKDLSQTIKARQEMQVIKEAISRKTAKDRFGRKLHNRHLLNLGIDLLKPYRVSKSK